jgi:hypothetical protein
MKCDSCGRDFNERPVFETHEVTAGLTGRARAYIRNTTTESIVLCPQCAARRRNLPWFILAVMGSAIAFGIIAALVRLAT